MQPGVSPCQDVPRQEGDPMREATMARTPEGVLPAGADYRERVIARLVHISRPLLWVNTVGSTVVGMWLTGDLWRWEVLPLLLWATLPFNLLIYGVNDIFDQDTDAQNARKGGLEGARI